MTEAGQKLLQKFLDAEAAGRQHAARNGAGEVFLVLCLETGNGAQKATAERLRREGLAGMQWTRSQGSFAAAISGLPMRDARRWTPPPPRAERWRAAIRPSR